MSRSPPEVVKHVAVRQYDVDRDAVTGMQRKYDYTGLNRACTEKVTDVNTVAFDERENVLAPAESSATLADAVRQLRPTFIA